MLTGTIKPGHILIRCLNPAVPGYRAYATGMNAEQLIAVIGAATALVVAVTHLVADVTGLMDKARRRPVRPPTEAPPSLPPAPPQTGA